MLTGAFALEWAHERFQINTAEKDLFGAWIISRMIHSGTLSPTEKHLLLIYRL